MCYGNEFRDGLYGDYDRRRHDRCGRRDFRDLLDIRDRRDRDRLICECREVDDRRDRCGCRECRRRHRRREFICRCWER